MATCFPQVRLVGCLILLALSRVAGLQAAPARPNIVVILSDDMGFSDLGCYGGEIATPNLDHLAASGVRFTQFYNTARCCPTRAALLTGLYSHQAGIGHMTEDKGLDGFRGELNRKCVTIAEALKPAGYRNYAVGKWHVCHNVSADGDKHDWPMQRGFDHFYGTPAGAGSYWDPSTLTRDNTVISAFADPEYHPDQYYYTDAIADHAIRFATEHARDHASEPFFMYVAFTAAHWPLHAKEADIAKYHGKYDAGFEAIRQARFAKAKQLGVIEPNWTLSPTKGDWEKVGNKAWETRCMEVYAAQIDCLDQNIGRLVAALKANGQLDNTLLLFLQDNGACAEEIDRNSKVARLDYPTLPIIAADVIRREMRPKQTRDGFPVLGGPGVMPGPPDTFQSYGESWANVSNTPFRLYKHFEHEGGISTPCIAHWPAGIDPARQNTFEKQPAHVIDIMATCVDLAGAQYPVERKGEKITPLQGVSLRPAFHGESLARPAPLFFEHEGNRAIRDGTWKLVAKNPGGAWELYDTTADRTEMHDIAAQQPEKVKELIAKWETWGKNAGVLPWPWKPAYGGGKSDAKMHFDLKAGASLSGDDAPQIAGQSLALRVEITNPAAEGVLVAQGGLKAGFTLYLKQGKLIFAIRHGKNLQSIVSADRIPAKPGTITATVSHDGNAHLAQDGQPLADGRLDLPDQQPQDGLQVGRDEGGAVGDYHAPFAFGGQIGGASLDLGQ